MLVAQATSTLSGRTRRRCRRHGPDRLSSPSNRLALVTPQWPVFGTCGGLGCDNTGRPMDSKLNPAQADPHHDGDVVLLAPKDWTDAEEALSRLAHVVSDRRRPTAGSDFSAGPRVTEPSLDSTLCPPDLNNAPLPSDRPSL